MQPVFEKISPGSSVSFHVHTAEHPFLSTPLHYHPEIELIHVVKSYGTRIVGSSIRSFDEGDLVLVGSGIPHVWRNDEAFYKGNDNLRAIVRVVHFQEHFWGEAFTLLPEMEKVRRLFRISCRGISFTGKAHSKVLEFMNQIFTAESSDRLFTLINLLHYVAGLKQHEFLMAAEYQNTYNRTDCDRINKVYEYLLHNYSTTIRFDDLASLVHMSLPSLCRYFKLRTHRTITKALNEIRISQASKLLHNSTLSISEISLLTGYANYSHFCDQFRQVTGYTPSVYRQSSRFPS